MLIAFLRPIFWAMAILGLLWLPVAMEDLLTLKIVDPARCTLDAKTCDFLSH